MFEIKCSSISSWDSNIEDTFPRRSEPSSIPCKLFYSLLKKVILALCHILCPQKQKTLAKHFSMGHKRTETRDLRSRPIPPVLVEFTWKKRLGENARSRNSAKEIATVVLRKLIQLVKIKNNVHMKVGETKGPLSLLISTPSKIFGDKLNHTKILNVPKIGGEFA